MQEQQTYTVPFTATSTTGTTIGRDQPEQPEVIVHGEMVIGAIAALGGDLETLRDRLHSVLRPDVPHDVPNATSDPSPQMLRSPLSDRLVATHSQVYALGRVVADLLNRLEV